MEQREQTEADGGALDTLVAQMIEEERTVVQRRLDNVRAQQRRRREKQIITKDRKIRRMVAPDLNARCMGCPFGESRLPGDDNAIKLVFQFKQLGR